MNNIHIAPDIIPLLQKGSYKVIRQGDSVFIQVNSKKVDFSKSPFSTIENASIVTRLQSLQVVPDLLNYNILLMAKQLSMKLGPELINLARNIAIKFPGKEKKAAELVLILKSKGIKPTLSLIEKLLEELDTETSAELDSNNQKSSQENREQKSDDPSNIILNFLKSLDSVKSEEGKLTVVNHLPEFSKSKSNLSWVYIPFDILKQENLDTKEGSGILKLLLNSNTKQASKIHIETSYKKQNYIFHFELTKGLPSKLYWSDGNSEENTSETNILQTYVNNIPVFWKPKEELENLAQGLDKIETVEAML